MKRILTILYFGIILLLSIIFYYRPDYNWDLLPYMALSMESGSTDFKAVHSDVYRIAKAELPQHKYDVLIDSSSAYRHITATEPGVFQHELGFYRTRPLYVWLIRLFHWVGFPLTKATVLPPVLAFFMIGLLLYFMITETHYVKGGFLRSFFSPQRRKGAKNNNIDDKFLASSCLSGKKEQGFFGIRSEIKTNAISLSFCLVIMVSPFMVNTARLSTPDMLVAFFLLSGSWLLLEKRSIPIVSALFLLALLTRYDCILYILLMLIWVLIIEKKRILRWWLLFAGMVIITIFQFRDILFILKHLFSIMPSSDRLAGSPGNGLFLGYVKSLKNGFPSFFYSQVVLISFIFLADIILRRRILHTGWKDPSLLFALFVYAYIPVRYIMQPVIDDRFVVAGYIILLLFFLKTLNCVLELKMLNLHKETPDNQL